MHLGAGGTAGSVQGAITDNATLAFDRSDAVTFTQIVSGTGGVVQLGSGTLTIDAAQNYTGLTDVRNGTLVVGDATAFGTSLAGAAQVEAGATLSGFGAVNGNLANGGTVQPGATGAVGHVARRQLFADRRRRSVDRGYAVQFLCAGGAQWREHRRHGHFRLRARHVHGGDVQLPHGGAMACPASSRMWSRRAPRPRASHAPSPMTATMQS